MDPTLLAHPTPPPPNPPMPQVPPTPPPAPPAKRSKWFFIGLAGIILGGLCCLLVIVAILVTYGLNRKAAPAATAAPVRLLPATIAPLATLPPATLLPVTLPLATTIQPVATATNPVLDAFHDDFSDSHSGWLVKSTDNTQASYNSLGFFEMVVKKAEYYLVATSPDNLPRPLKDVLINVRAQPGQTNTGDYGVVCRFQDIDNFYLAGISGDQFYIGKQVKGQWTYLTDPKLQALPDKTPDAEGYLAIGMSCINSFIVLEVNGMGAAHVTDSDFSSGDAGLAVRAGSSSNSAGYYAQAGFDDFSLEVK